MIQNWYQSSGLVAPTGGTSGYCQARSRLKESFLRKLSAKTNASLQRGIKSSDLWHGHVVKSIDGSSVLLMDTKANQLKYPQPSSQKPGCGVVHGEGGLMGCVFERRRSQICYSVFSRVVISSANLEMNRSSSGARMPFFCMSRSCW